MIGIIAVGLSVVVLLLPSVILILVEAQRQVEEPPGELELAVLTQKRFLTLPQHVWTKWKLKVLIQQ